MKKGRGNTNNLWFYIGVMIMTDLIWLWNCQENLVRVSNISTEHEILIQCLG